MALLDKEIAGVVEAADGAREAMQRYAQAVAGAAKAHVDAARTAGGFAEQLRDLNEAVDGVANSFKFELNPVAERMTEMLKALADRFDLLDESTKGWMLAIAAVVALAAGAIIHLSLLAGAILTLLTPIGRVIAAIVGAGGLIAVLLLFKDEIGQSLADAVDGAKAL